MSSKAASKDSKKRSASTKGSKKSVKKDTKRAKKEKDPNAPKRGQTAFFLFMADNRERVKRENSDIKHTEIAKLLGEEWKNINAASKAKYEALAKKDKERYEKEMAAYGKKDKKKSKKEESDEDSGSDE